MTKLIFVFRNLGNTGRNMVTIKAGWQTVVLVSTNNDIRKSQVQRANWNEYSSCNSLVTSQPDDTDIWTLTAGLHAVIWESLAIILTQGISIIISQFQVNLSDNKK